MNNIKIKYLNDTYDGDNALRFIDGKSDWIVLRCAETVEIKAGEHALLPLGVAMQLPSGYEAWVVPRSSTFKNFGVIQTNHIGVIDSSYCGDNDFWFMSVLAMRDTVILKGDRICQFRLMKNQDAISFETVDTLSNPDRGGHGSSGKN